MNKMKNMNKKGAIGAAMTWMVATVIIIFIIVLFTYISFILSKEKQAENFSFSFNLNENSDMSSEQILISLLKTKVEDKSIMNHILEGDYEKINEIKPILEKLSNEELGYWNFYIYENNNVVKKIKTKDLSFEILGKKSAEVNLDSNKRIKLSLH